MIKAVALRVAYNYDPKSFYRVHSKQTPPPFPRELRQYWTMLDTHIPPYAGGQRDQPPGWFEKTKIMHDYYTAYARYLRSERDIAWRRANEYHWQCVQVIEDIIYGSK